MHLRDSIHSDLVNGEYECVICLNNVRVGSPMWNCSSCYRVFDLKCVRDWGQRNVIAKKTWSCPFCLLPQSQAPSSLKNKCWCGKSKPKQEVDRTNGMPPHSCGKPCNAKRSCPHPCPLTCHAGPHLDVKECTKQGPKTSCYCGKHKELKPCNETKYGGFSCGNICGKKNKICGHSCPKPCHKQKKSNYNSCGPCKQLIEVKCHCGKVENTVKKCSNLSTSDRKRLGSNNLISCQNQCGHVLQCGKHKCERKCHRITQDSHICPNEPYEGETCFCGAQNANRSSCEDPIPKCGNICNKMLPCGHKCQSTCHEGSCSPCERIVPSVPCRCGYSKIDATCTQVYSGSVLCDRKCNALLSCHRHQCLKACCEFSSQQQKKKSRKETQQAISLSDLLSGIELSPNPQISEAEEAAHLCTAVCGRVLSCGAHNCQQACHPGKCQPCSAVSFDEWRCNCGKTSLDPPIRCGTTMPYCRYPCNRPRPCGHKSGHLCHQDDTTCPPCNMVLSFPCKCGKSTVKVHCYELDSVEEKIKNYNCLTMCNKELECHHKCQQKCCDAVGKCPPCNSNCGIVNSNCGHRHEEPCHYPSLCPEVCHTKLTARCPCGVLNSTYECGEDVEIGCNEICLKEKYPPSLLAAFDADPAWMMTIETQIRNFVRKGDRKSLWLKPMNRKNRRRVYELIEHYGLTGQSLDEGEKRSVCVYLTENRWLPSYLLKNSPRKDPILTIDETYLPELVDPTIQADSLMFQQHCDADHSSDDNTQGPNDSPSIQNAPVQEEFTEETVDDDGFHKSSIVFKAQPESKQEESESEKLKRLQRAFTLLDM